MSTPVNETVADTFSLSDGLCLGFGFNPSDSLTLSSAVGNSITWLIPRDSFSFSDSIAISLGFIPGVGVSDSFNFSDRAQLFGSASSVFTDSLTLSDTVIVVCGINTILSDNNVPTDAASEILTPNALTESSSDSLILSDTAAELLTTVLLETLSDTLSLSDSASVVEQLAPSFISVSDLLSLSDSACVVSLPTFNAYIRRYLNDTI